MICYDVEFPELSRLMADQGMQILFVPFLTDTQNAYSRVRVCAQARAIENECFVVIAGSVGNLPRVHNMDIQYAQSGVFTPCDFAFPTDGKTGGGNSKHRNDSGVGCGLGLAERACIPMVVCAT